MANLVELYDLVIQAQALNGVPLSHGHVYVYALGRTKLMDTWSDIDGESLNPNPVILDNAGQAHIYVSDDFDYTLVFTDEYDNEIFSVDKYLLSKGEHSHADVAVAPSEHIGVSSYHVGEVTVYVPYLTGEVGKVYEGIDPIVVNNDVNRISANHIPLGVQDPLYFVEDSETACIIGFSGQTVPEGTMTESALGFENNKITGYNGSAFSAGNEYEAGNYVSINNNTISVTGLQPEGDYAYNSALSSKLDVTALPQDLVHSGDLTAYYPIDNPSGFITGVDLTDYATTAQLDEKLDKTDSGNFYPMEGNPSGFLTAHQSLQGYATEQWVEDKGYITGIDIQESANWNEATTVVNNNSAIWNNTTNVVSSNSAQWAGGTANPQIPVTGINGIKISESGDKVVFEVSADYYTNDNPSGFITGVDLSDYATNTQLQTVSADITALIPTALTGDYVEKSAINTITGDNGEYIWTAITGIDNVWISASEAGYATRALTAQTASRAEQAIFAEIAENWRGASGKLDNSASANFYTTANESGFISEVPDTYLQNTDLTIVDNKITKISGVPLSAGSTPTYSYTDNDLISAIDISGLYATSALEAVSANVVKDHGILGYDLSSYLTQNTSYFYWMPANSPWTTADYATGIFAPLQYSTGACLAMNNPATFKGFYKGNEWFIANTVSTVGQMLRGEVHRTRGVHISGATTAGYGFNLSINNVSGVDSVGSWKYGYQEDAALRAVSSCDMHESAFGYDANDKISGYNGSAFAGGSDVPEGVMVESGLEYNAVNEISGYNGSAIAQYGAEKQWLVHDDTLVHASNSAQYALGVNLSAVAQLLGVDETVLWTNSNPSMMSSNVTLTGTFSENCSAFEKLRFICKGSYDYNESFSAAVQAQEFYTNESNYENRVGVYLANRHGNTVYRDTCQLTFKGTGFTASNGSRLQGLTAMSENTTRGPYILQVIGIGRKA